jgi:phosphate ABC transporter phosphate-binding protein
MNRRWKTLSRALAAVSLAGAMLPVASPAFADTGYVPVSGAGSTWSQNALDQWRRDVNSNYGIKINYQGTGSSDGRNQFKANTVDFAVSEIPYGLTDGGVTDYPPTRKFAYMPIVAGGTSFMYNLTISGHRVTNLRLSGDVIAKIFTGTITSWADPAIKADNPGLSLPARKIVPVVRSDGSGTTAQLTTWLSRQYESIWDPYCARAGRATPCGFTSIYPTVPGSGFVAQSGSLGVAGYVSQSQSEGAITYVEYSYALNTGFPVVKLLNKAGYYIEPKASAVAVGLLNARINNDPTSPSYLTQDLTGVYNSTDPRAYPLSSYSYMIVPTEVAGNFSLDKGRTLGKFAYYFLCEGQRQADSLGYSPLPINLVQAGLDQVRKIPGVDVQSINIKTCDNPTFSANGTNTLATTAPQPPACDKQGAYQCATGTGGDKASTPVPGPPASAGGPSGSPSGAPITAPTGSTVVTGSTGGGTAVIDPDTGQAVQGSGSGSDTPVVGSSVVLADSGGWGIRQAAPVLIVLLLLFIAFAPPLVSRALRRGGSR